MDIMENDWNMNLEHVVNARNRNGATPLMLAVQGNHLQVVEELLSLDVVDSTQCDAQGATPLRAAVLLGHANVVAILLRHHGLLKDDFSFVDQARRRGHAEVVDLLERHEEQQQHDVESMADQEDESTVDVEATLLERPIGTGLPPGAVLTTCPDDVRVERARCHLVNCHADKMDVVDAMSVPCNGGQPCPFRPLGDMIKTMVEHQVRYSSPPTWKFTQTETRWHMVDHLPQSQRRSCSMGDPACTVTATWASGCTEYHQPDGDVWRCLFGRAEAAENVASSRCDCTRDDGNDDKLPSLYTDRDVSALLYAAILLDGNRTSPHLTPGPALPPYKDDDDGGGNGIAVSVHVRAGDSCDVVNWSANQTSWALWPFEWTGVQGTDWNRVQRFCVHPSVHLAVLRGLLETHNVTRVLLATDSEEAVELFRKELPQLADGKIALQLNTYDRSPLTPDHHQNPSATDHWIETRAVRDPDFAAHAMHTALEDVRLLARGNMLIAAMCSNFAKMVYATMLGHSGKDIPVVSVDTCEVVCGTGQLQFTPGLDFVHG